MKPNLLVPSTYRPNYSDPRVKARVASVLAFCKPMLVEKKARPISSASLTKVFGNQKSALAARLRHKLLQQEGTYKPGKHSFSYSLKREGYAELSSAIGQSVASDLDVAREVFGAIASGAEVPEYTEPTPGARRYHAVQNLPKALRAQVFKGWFDYDIEAAAPTLVYQLACRVIRDLYPEKTAMPYLSVAKLVEDRANVRQHIADVTGLDIETAKSIVVALFFGAKLGPNGKLAIYRLVGMDQLTMHRLKADQFVRDFRRDVAAMWQIVLSNENANNGLSTFKGGPVVTKAATKSKQRMAVYLRLERLVMDAVASVLLADQAVHVLIHDGFMVKTRVDLSRLEQVVREQTGYSIRLAETRMDEAEPDESFELIEEG